ncbi:hypothetical protein BJ973_005665 [Actinoplanes tereljensis]|uniref:Uncharacterized protein n=1 Tax=Paractinoplanes tereljensis TaxID=571912 RepID=A0A919NYJ7_9ACTN|nr:hypothetical protein [Actinoplanes tereljensis]GIF26306.1 hypothetical protein Ate02nite_90360 [Actinoplanes tereljensis]
MGIDWWYNLYLPARNVATALRAVAARARADSGPVRVTLPGGEELTMPFTSNFRNRISIGLIYLHVWYTYSLRPGYVSMSFTAAVTGMSHLFADSSSVRGVFTDLAAEVGAVCCVFDREGDGDEICWPVTMPCNRDSLKELAATWP